MIFPNIILKRICSASAFFFNNPCPFCAPANRAFINIWALNTQTLITYTVYDNK